MSLALLERHRDTLRHALSDALSRDPEIFRALRYHVGLEDDAGQPDDGMGKMVRPAIVMFIAEELGGSLDRALHAAVGLELVHNFSLIHDDIQDQDRTRRGRATLWTQLGEAQAINAGDLMHAIAISEALRSGPAIAERLLGATEAMIVGQTLDLHFEDRAVDEAEYLHMIDHKTGALLRCAFELGGICAGASEDVICDLRQLGHGIGRAFQIRDDVLGIWGNGDVFGKPQGSDIRRRKKSYPVAVGFSRAGSGDRETLERIYAREPVREEDVEWVIRLLERLGVRDSAAEQVRIHLEQAQDAASRIALSERGTNELNALIEFLARRQK